MVGFAVGVGVAPFALADVQEVVAVGVITAEEVFAVFDEYVPDYEGVFDGFVFAVEDAAVEEVDAVAESEDSWEFVDLFL